MDHDFDHSPLPVADRIVAAKDVKNGDVIQFTADVGGPEYGPKVQQWFEHVDCIIKDPNGDKLYFFGGGCQMAPAATAIPFEDAIHEHSPYPWVRYAPEDRVEVWDSEVLDPFGDPLGDGPGDLEDWEDPDKGEWSRQAAKEDALDRIADAVDADPRDMGDGREIL